MKYDKKIKSIIREIKFQSDDYLSEIELANECAYTDKIIENIVKKSKELEQYHEKRFERSKDDKKEKCR